MHKEIISVFIQFLIQFLISFGKLAMWKFYRKIVAVGK